MAHKKSRRGLCRLKEITVDPSCSTNCKSLIPRNFFGSIQIKTLHPWNLGPFVLWLFGTSGVWKIQSLEFWLFRRRIPWNCECLENWILTLNLSNGCLKDEMFGSSNFLKITIFNCLESEILEISNLWNFGSILSYI